MTLYVATDLSRHEVDVAVVAAGSEHADLRIHGQLFRAFSPEYYAYLRHQMQRVKQAAAAGQVTQEAYRPLADRFNALHADAVAWFGEDGVRAAVRSFNPQVYRVPGKDVTVIDVQLPPRRTWVGQGSLAGFEAGGTPTVAPVTTAPVQIGQCVRIVDAHVTITGYHAPDDDFPGGWIDVVTDDGLTGSADLRFVRDLQGQAILPMTLTADEPRIAAIPDEPLEWTNADLDVSNLPEPHYDPAGDDPALRFYQPVGPSAVEQIDAIRDEALALGWTDAMLYQNRGRFAFPCGQDYGVVCHLGHQRRIGAVTAEAIELSTPTGHVLRCYRPTAPQMTEQEKNDAKVP